MFVDAVHPTHAARPVGCWAPKDVTLQLAEVAVPRELFRKILTLIDDLRRRPVPAEAGEIDGRAKTTEGVCLNAGNSGKMAFQAMTDLQKGAIGRLPKGCRSSGGGTVVRFPRISMLSGECRMKAQHRPQILDFLRTHLMFRKIYL